MGRQGPVDRGCQWAGHYTYVKKPPETDKQICTRFTHPVPSLVARLTCLTAYVIPPTLHNCPRRSLQSPDFGHWILLLDTRQPQCCSPRTGKNPSALGDTCKMSPCAARARVSLNLSD